MQFSNLYSISSGDRVYDHNPTNQETEASRFAVNANDL
jgi:hypothetical protein